MRRLELGGRLDGAGREEDLELARVGHVLPRLDALAERRKGHARGDVAVEGDARLVDDPADRRRHGDARVLDLGGAEPRERRRRAEVREAGGVPAVGEGVRRALLEVRERAPGRGLRRRRRRRHEARGAAEREGGDELLHRRYLCARGAVTRRQRFSGILGGLESDTSAPGVGSSVSRRQRSPAAAPRRNTVAEPAGGVAHQPRDRAAGSAE